MNIFYIVVLFIYLFSKSNILNVVALSRVAFVSLSRQLERQHQKSMGEI
jgi:hypothetical protein